MKITAVIAEYNPLHKGHAYHLREARRLSGADFLLVVMSGNFVQRGEPAVMDKYLRAEAALLCGADLVLELPVPFACASAEKFAAGAVDLLNGLGCVDTLCFGSESGDLSSLDDLAGILADEPPRYQNALKSALKTGLSFPKAREYALSQCLPETASLLRLPNDILAVEYLKALKRTKSSIRPLAVQRLGDYRETALDAPFSSALALRKALSESRAGSSAPVPDAVLSCIPNEARTLFCENYGRLFPIFPNDLSPMLHYRLLQASGWEEFARCADVPEELARRIYRERFAFTDLDAFTDLVHTKNRTKTQVRRALLHILLDLPDLSKNLPASREGQCFYARILGLQRSAQPLLGEIKKHGRLPLLSKPADARAVLSSPNGAFFAKRSDALTFFETDMRCSQLYQAAVTAKFGQPAASESAHPLLVLPDAKTFSQSNS